MKHIVLIVFLLLGAVASYAAGFEFGVVVLLVVGGLLELAFWGLALRGGKRNGAT
jgi:hypothetical protein